MYNNYRKWRNHKHGFPRYRKKHIYNVQITDVFFIYSLFVHCINIIANKATFMAVELISPIIRNIRNSIINTTSLSQSSSLICKVETTSAYSHFLWSILATFVCQNQANKTIFFIIKNLLK